MSRPAAPDLPPAPDTGAALDLLNSCIRGHLTIQRTPAGVMEVRPTNQRAIAGALGLSQAGLSKRLNGITPWAITELIALSRVLGVPLADLLATEQVDALRLPSAS